MIISTIRSILSGRKVSLVIAGLAVATGVNLLTRIAGELGEQIQISEGQAAELRGEVDTLTAARYSAEATLSNLSTAIARARREYADVVNPAPAAEPEIKLWSFDTEPASGV